jgi:hypothetical protein
MVMLRFASEACVVGVSESVTVTPKLIGPVTLPVGVPLICPVDVFRVRPVGKLPIVTAHE